MLEIQIPGQETLQLNHLVLDYNGTIAFDGELIDDIAGRLTSLSNSLAIHIITADTHGTVADKVKNLPVELKIITPHAQDKQKEMFVQQLEQKGVVAVGNGKNDCTMLSTAALGIGIIQGEGAAAGIALSADVLCTDIVAALDLLLFPDRLRATLRN